MISPDDVLKENRHLRRTMRDLLALSSLPAGWSGQGLEGIARSLANGLLSTLSLDLVYVRLRGMTLESEVEIAHGKRGSDAADLPAVKAALGSVLEAEPVEPPASIPNPFGEGRLQIAVARLGLGEDQGVVVAGSRNADFPTEEDRLLLDVGANQTSIILQQHLAEERLHRQQEWLRVTLASIGDAVIATDTEGRVTFLNSTAEELTGWIWDEAQGRPLDAVFEIRDEETRGSVENPIERVLRAGAVVGLGNHTVLVAKDGTERPIDNRGAPIRDAAGKIIGVVLIFRDVTEKRRIEQQRSARLAVTQVLAHAQNVQEAFRGVLEAVCNNLHWDVGFFWTLDDQAKTLVCRESWHRADMPMTQFETVSRSRRFERGEGLPGRVWVTGEPAWLLDVTQDDNFPRAMSAAQENLQSAFACPILVGDQLLGVVEFFTHRIRELDPNLLEMMGTMAGFVGQLIERIDAEEKLREQTLVAETLNQIGMILAAELDLDKTVQAVTDEGTKLTSAEFGAFFYNVLDDRGGSYMLYALSGVPREAFSDFPMPRNTAIFGPTFRGDGVVRLDDVMLDPRYGQNEPYHGMPEGHLSVRSYLAVPVISRGGEVFGGLFFGHSQVGVFTRRHERIIVGVASQAAIAIENARLYQRTLESEERFLQLAENVDDVFWIADLKKPQVLFISAAYERVWGRSRQSLYENCHSFLDAVHPDDRPRVMAAMERQAGGESLSEEYRVIRPDGSVRWVLDRGFPIRDENGRVYRVAGIAEDITERKRADQELADASRHKEELLESLRESEEKFRLLANTIPQLAWMARPDGHIFWHNERSYQYTGRTPKDIEGWSWQSVIDPDALPEVLKGWKGAIASGESFEMVFPIKGADGHFRPFLTRVNPLKDEKGRILYWFGTNTDISEQQRSAEISRFLADASAILGDMVDNEGTLRNVAWLAVPFFADWCAVDMVSEEGTLERSAVAHVDPDKVEAARELSRRFPSRPTDSRGPQHVFRTGQSELVSDITDDMLVQMAQDEAHLRILRDLGFQSYLCVPLAARGRILGVLTFITAESDRRYGLADLQVAEDLAQRIALAVDNASLFKTAQDALRQKEESLALLNTLQRNAPAGFAFVDREFRYVRINEALAEIDGHPPEHHLGRTVQETVPKLWPKLEPLYRRVLESELPVLNQEVTGETPAAPGQDRHWLVNYYPVRVHEEVLGIGILVADITERKRLENELRHQAVQLAEADRRKDEFLATLAHELRNPLAPIRTGLEVMKLIQDDPLMLEDIRNTMQRQTEQLITLVDDLLDVSRITRGKLELRRCRVKLSDVVQSAVEASKPLIDDAGHGLSVAVPDSPIDLDADPHRLAQVLSNLLNNAAKYTPDGGRIRLSAERFGGDVVISVKDNGIGIPPEMMDRIFEMFTQIDRPMEKGYTGLGIGLTLVKSLVEMHGGRIEVHSDGSNQGSEFRVRLPVLAEMPAEDKKPVTFHETIPAKTKRRVLVVDDNEAAAKMLCMVVKMLGNEVRMAADGQQGIEVAEAFLPDVILMDLGMPKLNGYEAARHIRQQPWGERILLVALTGWGQDEDKQRTKEAGFDYHLVKPAEPAELQRLLAEPGLGHSTERMDHYGQL